MRKIVTTSGRVFFFLVILVGAGTPSFAQSEACKSAHQELLLSLDKVGDAYNRLDQAQARIEDIFNHLGRMQEKTFRMAGSSQGISDFQKEESKRVLTDLDQSIKKKQTTRQALDQSLENFTHKSLAFEKLCFKK